MRSTNSTVIKLVCAAMILLLCWPAAAGASTMDSSLSLGLISVQTR